MSVPHPPLLFSLNGTRTLPSFPFFWSHLCLPNSLPAFFPAHRRVLFPLPPPIQHSDPAIFGSRFSNIDHFSSSRPAASPLLSRTGQAENPSPEADSCTYISEEDRTEGSGEGGPESVVQSGDSCSRKPPFFLACFCVPSFFRSKISQSVNKEVLQAM